VRFPSVSGTNLQRRRMTLPRDLAGEINLLLVAFWQRHQALVDTWMPLAQRIEERYEGFAAYELPVIQNRSRFSRWFIDSGMRAGIPNPQVRERTITLYLDKAEFLDALEISDDGTIYAILVDRSGEVLWHNRGPLDPAKKSDLMAFLDSRSTPAP